MIDLSGICVYRRPRYGTMGSPVGLKWSDGVLGFLGVAPTGDMLVQQIRYLIQEQAFQVDLPKPLFQCSRAVRNDVDDFCHKVLVCRNLVVPALYKLPQDDGQEGVELEIHVVPTRQGREKLVDGSRRIPPFVPKLLRA